MTTQQLKDANRNAGIVCQFVEQHGDDSVKAAAYAIMEFITLAIEDNTPQLGWPPEHQNVPPLPHSMENPPPRRSR